MKSQYLIIIIFTFILTSCSSHNIPRVLSTEEIQLEKIFQVSNLNKDEIFDKSKMWIPRNLESVKMVIMYENRNDGIIISNGSIDTVIYKNAYPISVNATFVMQENIKDGKVRIRIGNIQNTMGIAALYEESKKPILDQINILIDGLQRHLLNSDKKDNW